MKYAVRLLVLAVATLTLLSACSRADDATLIGRSRRLFGAMPAAKPAPTDTAQLVHLGRALYFSNELSVNRKQSCNSCHPIDRGRPGADDLRVSPGALGSDGRRNSPTVFNTDLHFALFWDGRARSLEEQAGGPMLNRAEMGMPHASAVAERLRALTGEERDLFVASFPNERDPFTLDNAARAIAAFERTLRTTDRFDEYQWGNTAALTHSEKQGLAKFMAMGCTSCHNGPAIGARQFQKVGIVNAYPTSDKGRFELTNKAEDEFVFKVPSLRNVARTAPYFHDGSAQDLNTAVEKMAWHQLGIRILPQDRDAIVAFLKALTDDGKRTTGPKL